MDRPVPHARLLVAALLALHALLLLVSARLHFVTVDESGHIPAGLSHWRTGRFDLYRVNPPLPRMLATLPLLLAGADTNFGALPDQPGARPEWVAGQRFAAANAERYLDLLRLARLAGVVWSLLGGLLLYRWSSELHGPRAGLLALVLWCFEPNILAHAGLATADLPATVAGLAATYASWRYLRAPSWSAAWFTGLLLGIAQLTKFTWLLLYGLWPLLALLYWWSHRDRARVAIATRCGQGLFLFGLSLLVLNVGYGFQGTGRPLGDYTFISRLFAGQDLDAQGGNRFRDTWLGGVPVPLPADYLLGIDLQRRDFEAEWPFYLAGEWHKGGCWYFYLYALALKVPLGILALVLGAAVALGLGRRTTPLRDELVPWTSALVILIAVSSQTGLNYFRYLLPMMPLLLLIASGGGRLFEWTTCKRGLVVAALAGWSVAGSLLVFPHCLSYFNEAAGGPKNGHHHLVDSNLDWGQDLLFLQHWLKEHPEARELGLASFSPIDPRILGIHFRLPPLTGEFGPRAGTFAVSVHFIQGGAFLAPDGQGRLKMVPREGLSYFRQFQPIARAGYTLWIYHITAEEANEVRQRFGWPLLNND